MTPSVPWQTIAKALLDLVFPPRCVACRRPGEWFCQACRAQVTRVPFQDPDRFLTSPRLSATADEGIQEIRSIGYHQGVLREAIHHFKYEGVRALAEPFGEMLEAHWRPHPLPADVLVPVPLHARRLRERGYNQSHLLALALAERVSLPVDASMLERTRYTLPQVGLSAQERQENVRDAFASISDAPIGQRIVLIDDVCTTGATLDACAIALRERGAWTVSALTLARAAR